MILHNINSFLDDIFNKIQDKQIDVLDLYLDHLGYQSSSNEDYDLLKPQFLEIADEKSEAIVGNRRVGIFKLKIPIIYQGRIIPAIELIAPKENQICPSGWEHVEFVINEEFNKFNKKYSNLSWDTSKTNQPDFPMIT